MKENRIASLLKEKFNQVFKSIYFFPIFLLFVTFVTYGIFIPTLGFYGDDFSLAWLAYKVGSVDSFFAINRPIWGQIFLAVSKIISSSPWQWQLFFILLRWLISLQIYYIFRSIKMIDERAAYWISLLFLVYPGSLIFYQPLTFSVHFLAFTILFSSFWLSIISIQNKEWRLITRITGLLFSFMNLILTEFFYFLELIRPFLIWLALGEKEPKLKLKRTAIESVPYLILFIAISLYRSIYQTTIIHYEPILIHDFLSSPINTLLKFIPIAIQDMYNFGVKVWINAFQPQAFIMQQGKTTSLIYFLLVAISSIGIFYYMSKLGNKLFRAKVESKKGTIAFILIGLIALFLAGLPPWIANLSTSMEITITNRFAQAFALGSAMVVVGLLLLLPKRSKLPLMFFALICAFSIGTHFFAANQFRYDWIEQKRFFWQMTWRFPTLPAPATIIADYSTVKIEAENPLSSGINWIYFHESYGKTQDQIGYYLYYDEPKVLTQMNGLREPLPPMSDHLIGHAAYENYHLLTIMNDRGCMQVLDPLTASIDPTLPAYLKRGAAKSDLNLTYMEDRSHAAIMDPQIFGEEPAHEWCYYFEKADLARSKSDWQEMLRLKAEARQKGFSPTQPSEKLIFLYAYLGTGNMSEAFSLSREVYSSDHIYGQMICRIWENMYLKEAQAQDDTILNLKGEFACKKD